MKKELCIELVLENYSEPGLNSTTKSSNNVELCSLFEYKPTSIDGDYNIEFLCYLLAHACFSSLYLGDVVNEFDKVSFESFFMKVDMIDSNNKKKNEFYLNGLKILLKKLQKKKK